MKSCYSLASFFYCFFIFFFKKRKILKFFFPISEILLGGRGKNNIYIYISIRVLRESLLTDWSVSQYLLRLNHQELVTQHEDWLHVVGGFQPISWKPRLSNQNKAKCKHTHKPTQSYHSPDKINCVGGDVGSCEFFIIEHTVVCNSKKKTKQKINVNGINDSNYVR